MPARFVSFQEVKARVGIRDVLARYGALDALKDKGHGKLVGTCPIHHGDNPNGFHVSTYKNIFNCFTSCGGGNVLDLVAKIEGVSIRDAALRLLEWFPVVASAVADASSKKPLRRARETDGARRPTPRVETEVRPRGVAPDGGGERRVNPPLDHELKTLDYAHRYLRERGLTEATIAAYGVGYCSRGLMKNRIAIPIRNETGELVAYAGRAVDSELVKEKGKYLLPAGFEKRHVLFNLNRAKKHAGKGLIVVEGFFDAMVVEQAGYGNVVALMGAVVTDEQEQLLVGSTDRLTLMFDGDEAGEKCLREFYRRLRRRMFLREVHLEPGEQPDNLQPERIRALLG